MPPTVLGYARVSTDEQAKEGWSLEAQREKIELYCRLHDFNLTQIISDEGISAKDVKGRPGMLQLLDMTTNGKKSEIDAIITVKLDRVFRNAAEALKYSKIWRKRGIQFHSIHEGVQTDGAAGKMFFALLAVLAEFERDQTSERTKVLPNAKRAVSNWAVRPHTDLAPTRLACCTRIRTSRKSLPE